MACAAEPRSAAPKSRAWLPPDTSSSLLHHVIQVDEPHVVRCRLGSAMAGTFAPPVPDRRNRALARQMAAGNVLLHGGARRRAQRDAPRCRGGAADGRPRRRRRRRQDRVARHPRRGLASQHRLTDRVRRSPRRPRRRVRFSGGCVRRSMSSQAACPRFSPSPRRITGAVSPIRSFNHPFSHEDRHPAARRAAGELLGRGDGRTARLLALVLRPERSDEVIEQFADWVLSEDVMLEAFDRLHAAAAREEGRRPVKSGARRG